MSEDSEFEALWLDAVKEYEAETHNDISHRPRAYDIKSADDLLTFLEDSSHCFRGFRSKHERLCSRLRRFSKPIILLGNLAANNAGTTFVGAPAALTITAVMQLLAVSIMELL